MFCIFLSTISKKFAPAAGWTVHNISLLYPDHRNNSLTSRPRSPFFCWVSVQFLIKSPLPFFSDRGRGEGGDFIRTACFQVAGAQIGEKKGVTLLGGVILLGIELIPIVVYYGNNKRYQCCWEKCRTKIDLSRKIPIDLKNRRLWTRIDRLSGVVSRDFVSKPGFWRDYFYYTFFWNH